jgi:transaldolase
LGVISNIIALQPGLIAVQTTETKVINIIEQAQKLSALSSNIIIKIPVTEDGLIAIKFLNELNIKTMATAIFEPSQILLSALAGARYAAPYFGRLQTEPLKIIECMTNILKINNFPTKLIVAALRNKQQVLDISTLGVDAITIPASVYSEIIMDNLDTLNSVAKFEQDWFSHHKVL